MIYFRIIMKIIVKIKEKIILVYHHTENKKNMDLISLLNRDAQVIKVNNYPQEKDKNLIGVGNFKI